MALSLKTQTLDLAGKTPAVWPLPPSPGHLVPLCSSLSVPSHMTLSTTSSLPWFFLPQGLEHVVFFAWTSFPLNRSIHSYVHRRLSSTWNRWTTWKTIALAFTASISIFFQACSVLFMETTMLVAHNLSLAQVFSEELKSLDVDRGEWDEKLPSGCPKKLHELSEGLAG